MSTALQPPAPAPAAQPVTRASRTFADILQTDRVKEQVAMALPKWLTAERMTRIALTTINRDTNLQQCTPESVLLSLMKASAMGIEPDGKHGHLIARFNSRLGKYECTFMEDYKGLLSVAFRSPNLHDVYAEVVRENDEFIVESGLHRDMIHRINTRAPRGEIIAAYAVVIYKGGGPSAWTWLSVDEIHESARDRSESWIAYKAGKISITPWVRDHREMCKKTMLKLLLKTANLSQDVAERVTLDVDATVTPVPQPQLNGPAAIPRPVFPGVSLPERTEEPLTQPPVTEPTTSAPPAGSPRRLQRAKAKNEPPPQPEKPAATKPPPPEDIPLPGGEPENQELAPARESEPAAASATQSTTRTLEPVDDSPLAQFRAQHPDAEDRHLLAVLIKYGLAKEGTLKLSDVPGPALKRAWEDPGTIAGEVKLLIEAEG